MEEQRRQRGKALFQPMWVMRGRAEQRAWGPGERPRSLSKEEAPAQQSEQAPSAIRIT